MNGQTVSADFQQHRTYLYRYALIQLRDADRAEDVVQETLLAAIEGSERFSGRSSVKTWLTGILKHKIIDQIRRQSREQPVAETEPEFDASDTDDQFQPDGHWTQAPQTWADPLRALENKRFWEIFEMCSAVLPPNTARVFMMQIGRAHV